MNQRPVSRPRGVAGSRPADVCLVSMPFIPSTTPGLGISTLKATLRQASISANVYYGALDYFRFFGDAQPPEQALFDYDFLASNGDLGDVFFSTALWGGSLDPVREAMSTIATSPNSLFSRREREGLMTRFLDRAAYAEDFLEYCLQRADFGRYRVIGFSSTFCQNVASLALARLIRERYEDAHIVFGGANCEGPMGVQLLQSFPWVDCVVQGEADHTFPEYVRRFLSNEDCTGVPGVLYRDIDGVRSGPSPEPLRDLDALPIPDFDDYWAQLPPTLGCQTNRGKLRIPLETSRGCWWGAKSHCTFCGLNPTMMTYRAKSPQRALAEFRHIRDAYGPCNVSVVDNILSMGYFAEVLPGLERLELDVFYETKANLKEEHVAQLARAGVRTIQPGIEGLNSEILQLMRKGVKASQNIALLKWCQLYGVKPVWFYLYGFPHEREECYRAAIPLIARLGHLPPPQNPNPVVVDRFSPLFRSRDDFGLTNLRPATRVDVCYRGLTAEARLNLSYHFEADLPQGSRADYVLPLWEAVLAWQRAYARGARFDAIEGEAVTLLVDTRRDGRAAYLLTGAGHALHAVLRNPCKADRLADSWEVWQGRVGRQSLSAADLAVLVQARSLDALELPGPDGQEGVQAFLDMLDERWITARVDDRYIGLAVPRAVAPHRRSAASGGRAPEDDG